MKFVTLKNYKKRIFIGVVVFVAVISVLIINPSKAKYRTTQSIPLVRGTIKYNPADLNLVAMYQETDNGEYISIDEVPASGYKINQEKSYCEVNGTKDENITIEYQSGIVSFDKLKKGTKCFLYFDVLCGKACKSILTNITSIKERPNFSTTVTETTTGVIYYAEDDDGETYYFAGNPTDNWVKFAGLYWRIIRINGDGSIRLIYAGTNPSVTTGAGTQISTSAFNSSYNNNMYVGYMYTQNQVHGLGASSTIKGTLDTWYTNNLTNYANYIDQNAGFCGDRTPYTNTTGTTSGTGTVSTYYGAYIRLYKNNSETNAAPSFKCPETSDLYTSRDSTKGNKALTSSIGLITADEVSYAGGISGGLYESNTKYYLYTSQNYWTISPSYDDSGNANVWVISSSGYIGYFLVSATAGVRPVINLKAGTTFASGSKGTTSVPYTVVE